MTEGGRCRTAREIGPNKKTKHWRTRAVRVQFWQGKNLPASLQRRKRWSHLRSLFSRKSPSAPLKTSTSRGENYATDSTGENDKKLPWFMNEEGGKNGRPYQENCDRERVTKNIGLLSTKTCGDEKISVDAAEVGGKGNSPVGGGEKKFWTQGAYPAEEVCEREWGFQTIAAGTTQQRNLYCLFLTPAHRSPQGKERPSSRRTYIEFGTQP